MRCGTMTPRSSWSVGAPGLGSSSGGGGVRRAAPVNHSTRRPSRDVAMRSMAPIGRSKKGRRAPAVEAPQPVATQEQQTATDPLKLLAALVSSNRPGPKSIEELTSYNRALVETVNDRVSSAFVEVASELSIAAAELPSTLQSFEDEVKQRANVVEALNDRVSSALLDAASELSIAAAELPIVLQGFEEEVEARAQAYMRKTPDSIPAGKSPASVQASSHTAAGNEAVVADPVRDTQETIDELQAELAKAQSIIDALKSKNAASGDEDGSKQ